MNRYRIKLTNQEVSEHQKVISKVKHTSQSYLAACILLNVDEGEYSLGKTNNDSISESVN